MMLRNSAEWLQKNPWPMVGITFGFAALPFFGWVASLLLVLATLMFGMRHGLWVLLAAMLGQTLVSTFIGGDQEFLFHWCMNISAIWLATTLLIYCRTWILTLEVLTALGAFAVIAFHLWVPDANAFWVHYYQSKLQQTITLLSQMGGQEQVIALLAVLKQPDVLQRFASLSTGAFAVRLIYGALIQVAIGVWWFDLLEPSKSGQLRQALVSVRNSYLMLLALLADGMIIYFGHPAGWDVLPLLLVPFVVAGVSLAHRLAARTARSALLLVVFYVGLILASPYSLLVVAIAAALDSLYDMRTRFNVAHQKEV